MNIDSCYEGIIAKLTKEEKIIEISKKILTLPNNQDRTLFVYDIVESLNFFPSFLEVNKCQKVSTHYRNLGNQCFQKLQNFEAWQYYNLALLHAPIDSDDYAIALSNRSAVFSILKKYNECLQDVNEVMSRNYPDNLVQKLTKRKALCEQALAKQIDKNIDHDDINNFITLEGPRNDRYVCASSKLEVVYNEEMGRHVVAKEDIQVGEILAEEDPYLTVLMTSQFLFNCNYCLSWNPNLYPCDKCCFTLYCSKKCKENAFKEYHEIECPLVANLIHMDFTKLELLALRIVIKARTDHNNWNDLIETVTKADGLINTEFQGHVEKDGKWIYDSKYYESVHTLVSNIDKRIISDIFQKGITSAIFLKCLSDKTDFLKVSNGEDAEVVRKLVAGLLLHHDMTSPTNMHGITCNIENVEGYYLTDTSIASGTYAFLSLLNHSCSPNVVRFGKLGTGTMKLFALRPIDKGMQLYDNYGSHHAIENRKNRQNSLKFQYKFTCLCEACVENWPTYITMRPARNLPMNIRRKKLKLLDSDVINMLQKGDKEVAKKIYKPLCELIEDLDCYAPCIELADCQESLKQCIVIFSRLVPYGYSKLIDWDAEPPNV